jgi:hypothetical protein
MSEENIIEGPWPNEDEAEFNTALEELLATHNEQTLGSTIAGVLEFLTARALLDGPFYLLTDDKQAITVIATDETATKVLESLPENVKSWEEMLSVDEPVVITDRDPGDEQDEPASEQE